MKQPPKDNLEALADPDGIHVIICCVECRAQLWEMKVLSRFGDRVGSTEYKSCADDIPAFSKTRHLCPKCNKRFYHVSRRGEHMYALKDVKTGELLVI